jgi:F-type H+-transporting ATPase subunit b
MTRAVAFLLTWLLPLAALAEEVEEHAGEHGIPWAKLVFSAINFAIFLYILRRLGWDSLRNMVGDRRAAIQKALEQAEHAGREAEALRAEWQQRLERLSNELEAMLQQARADIAAERDQILAAARQAAEVIRRDAQRTAENEIRSAREALRAEVAKQALAIAERRAPERLTANDQHRFVEEFVLRVNE